MGGGETLPKSGRRSKLSVIDEKIDLLFNNEQRSSGAAVKTGGGNIMIRRCFTAVEHEEAQNSLSIPQTFS